VHLLAHGRGGRGVLKGGDNRLEDRDEAPRRDVAADRARILRPAQQHGQRLVHGVLQRTGDRDGVGQVALGLGLLSKPGQEAEERLARVGGARPGPAVREQLFDPGRGHRLEQRFLRGEVPVHGSRPYPRAGGDLVQGHGEARRGEGVPGRAQHLLPVAPRVGPHRPAGRLGVTGHGR